MLKEDARVYVGGEREIRLGFQCLKFRKLINEKQTWAEDLPFMAPYDRCYFDHSKECTPECEYNIHRQKEIISELIL